VSALVRGATMMSMNWFEPEIALAHIEKRQAEHLFPAFPPLTLGLLRAPGYDPGRLTFVRTILNVAPADTQRVIEGLLPEETVLLTDFGMTEGAGVITVTPRDAAGEDRLTRNWMPLTGIEIRVTNRENPKTNQPNDVPGEIQFRGINAFRDLGTFDRRGQLPSTRRKSSAAPPNATAKSRSPSSSSSPAARPPPPSSRNSACASC
jgi:acyl-CoA synthetase (AMP-forming)/AMP-acid ligase II